MKIISSLTIFLGLLTISSSATTWLVGPAHVYTMPSQVSLLVSDGDTVAIDAGVYISDVAKWTANNLLLKGVGGMAHLKANGANYGGKAIWVIAGNNTTVDSIEFSLCSCVDQNGAGIRQEGINLTVSHCYFHDNEDGILAGDNITSDIIIEHSEFYNNGFGDGYSHNLYINHVNSLTFRYNYSHHAHIGHELKSRAYNNYILYNRLSNEATGDASREMDLPNGGLAIIIGNEIEQGPNTQNSNIIGYGLEGLSNPTSEIYLINNTIVNDKTNGSFVNIQNGTSVCKAVNNIFAGPGTIFLGNATTIDTSNNWYLSIAAAGMVDAPNFNYHLLSTCSAINNGINPGMANTFSLTPEFEYQDTAESISRVVNGQIDIGAHEFGTPSTTNSISTENYFSVYPNPSNGIFFLENIFSKTGNTKIEIYNPVGEIIYCIVNAEQKINIDFEIIPSGIYFLKIESGNFIATKRISIVK